MNEDIALHILSLASSGTLGTRDLVEATGRSPNTVVRYLRELEARGLVRRRVAGKIGAGRPRVLCEVTDAGLGRLRIGERELFAKLDREARIAWGPVRSLAHWGVPFFGWSDLFVDRPVDAPAFEVVVERNPALYEGAVAADGGRYPSLEAMAAWAAGSGNPRFAAAAALLLRDPRVDPRRLAELGARFRCVNRLGFLGEIAGANPAIAALAPASRWETMSPERGFHDPDAERAAARWRVRNPIPRRRVEEMRALYGDAR
jgi:DNA-binding MarR family transcriptional regulator